MQRDKHVAINVMWVRNPEIVAEPNLYTEHGDIFHDPVCDADPIAFCPGLALPVLPGGVHVGELFRVLVVAHNISDPPVTLTNVVLRAYLFKDVLKSSDDLPPPVFETAPVTLTMSNQLEHMAPLHLREHGTQKFLCSITFDVPSAIPSLAAPSLVPPHSRLQPHAASAQYPDAPPPLNPQRSVPIVSPSGVPPLTHPPPPSGAPYDDPSRPGSRGGSTVATRSVTNERTFTLNVTSPLVLRGGDVVRRAGHNTISLSLEVKNVTDKPLLLHSVQFNPVAPATSTCGSAVLGFRLRSLQAKGGDSTSAVAQACSVEGRVPNAYSDVRLYSSACDSEGDVVAEKAPLIVYAHSDDGVAAGLDSSAGTVAHPASASLVGEPMLAGEVRSFVCFVDNASQLARQSVGADGVVPRYVTLGSATLRWLSSGCEDGSLVTSTVSVASSVLRWGLLRASVEVVGGAVGGVDGADGGKASTVRVGRAIVVRVSVTNDSSNEVVVVVHTASPHDGSGIVSGGTHAATIAPTGGQGVAADESSGGGGVVVPLIAVGDTSVEVGPIKPGVTATADVEVLPVCSGHVAVGAPGVGPFVVTRDGSVVPTVPHWVKVV